MYLGTIYISTKSTAIAKFLRIMNFENLPSTVLVFQNEEHQHMMTFIAKQYISIFTVLRKIIKKG
jgi:uncharacterized protein YfaT (DUF1175 family)